MPEPSPILHEELYDVVVVRGVTSPGIVTLSGHDRSIGWDIKKGPGQSGATTTRTSEDPVEFTATFTLTDQVDFDAWPAFLDVLKATVGATPKAADIYHPDLAVNDIKSVVLRKIGGVVHDGEGGQSIAITLLEYRPPKPKGGTPKGSAAKKKTAGPDPDAALLAELAQLTETFRVTPWG
jgi:hypothetical protein